MTVKKKIVPTIRFRPENSLKMDILSPENIRLDVLCEGIQVAKEKLRARDIRSLLPDHFNDAEYLIGLIERTTDCLTGYVDHPELQPPALDDFKRLHSKYLILKIDITLFLGHIEHAYTHGITWHPYAKK
ncbi:hypothetical protein TNIN_412751 [Trichonephila inaurata madagascariensis]|uniref:Uncharacterized protein n=1 Tax=Trichonephila inaurata madagascariensis TaxID=2747483 RepID=A0A8X6XJI2_9ARAC|nr:hypothetical protein TNIN_412751 [Trichonephila inaurata madagascariensis]